MNSSNHSSTGSKKSHQGASHRNYNHHGHLHQGQKPGFIAEISKSSSAAVNKKQNYQDLLSSISDFTSEIVRNSIVDDNQLGDNQLQHKDKDGLEQRILAEKQLQLFSDGGGQQQQQSTLDVRHAFKQNDITPEYNVADVDVISELIQSKIEEGHGECVLELGSSQHGIILNTAEQLEHLIRVYQQAAQKLSLVATVVYNKQENDRYSAYLLIRHQVDSAHADASHLIELRVACVGNVDSGKCFAYDTKLLSADLKPIAVQDIKVGDNLFGPDGSIRTVLPGSLTRGSGMLYRIVPQAPKFSPFVVTGNHILVIQLQGDSSSLRFKITVVEFLSLPHELRSKLQLIKANLSSQFVDFRSYRGLENWVRNSACQNDVLKCFQQWLAGMLYCFQQSKSLQFLSKDCAIKTNFIRILLEIFQMDILHSSVIELSKLEAESIFDYVTKVYTEEERQHGGYSKDLYWNRGLRTGYLILQRRAQLLQAPCNYSLSDFCTELIAALKSIDLQRVDNTSFNQSAESRDIHHCEQSSFTVEQYGEGAYYGFEVDGDHMILLSDCKITHNSTTLGVLTSSDLDDGRGAARVKLFKHKHEIDTGRTSSVGLEIMGFDSTGRQVVKQADNFGRKLSWEEISRRAAKMISFIDLAGHERYLKTTVFGMTGCMPDYVMLMIGSNAGIIGMTKEHLGLALALNVPVFVVITKIDMCPANILESTIKQLTKILKSSGCRKIPIFINSMSDVISTTKTFVSERVCPIFQISNVSGVGVDLLRSFINLLPVYKQFDPKKSVHIQITESFSVPGVGCVVSGVLLNGTVRVGDSLQLGPDSNGHFIPAQIKSIHIKRLNVPYASAGQTACFALKKIKRSYLRKGMVLLGKDVKPEAVQVFEAEVLVLYHSSTIGKCYQTMVHVGNVRQAAYVLSITPQKQILESGGGGELAISGSADNLANQSQSGGVGTSQSLAERNVIRTGDRALVKFRFMKYPEYVQVGQRLLFREGRTKGVGKITRLLA
ncbi:hypothetical protein MP228_008840 [Amoeboaphelidium protococcarum]|nr:hypothetical protein MP228_008840 [Amoeboaphelidium protococcarum]